MDKPDVDFIEGLSPAISIDQKSASRNPRSTVGTITEIYDYLRLLYARIGVPHCPNCGRLITRQTPQQIVDRVLQLPEGTRFQVLAPVVRGRKGEYDGLLEELARQGYTRARVDGELVDLGEPSSQLARYEQHTIEVVVDRLVRRAGIERRLTDSLETALRLAEGVAEVEIVPARARRPKPEIAHVLRAPRVHALRHLVRRARAPQLLVQLALRRVRAVRRSRHPLRGRSRARGRRRRPLDRRGRDRAVVGLPEASTSSGCSTSVAEENGFSLDTPWKKLKQSAKNAVLYGTGDTQVTVSYRNRYGRQRSYTTQFEGVVPWLERRHTESESDRVARADRGLHARGARAPRAAARGSRPASLAVTDRRPEHLRGRRAVDPRRRRSSSARSSCRERDRMIAERVDKEVNERLQFLLDVGLDYLTLNRSSATLAGGEAQRIRLASQIGSGLVGVLYVLDEPSIGLHQRDNQRLIDTLVRLRDLGNTVIVVEHDEETIRVADHVVDIGPGAGEHGGEIVVAGHGEGAAQPNGVDHRPVPLGQADDRGARDPARRRARRGSRSAARASTT